MHILLIPSWYSTTENPVRGAFFRDQALALQKAGHQVGLLVPPGRVRTVHGLKEIQQHWPKQAITQADEDGLATYRIPWWGVLPSVLPPLRHAVILNAFEHYCREQGKPDIIHAHSALYGGWGAAQIRAVHRIPVVLTEHSSTLVRGLTFPDQISRVRFTLRHVNRALAVSSTLAKRLEQIAPDVQIATIDNLVDGDFFTLTPPPSEPFAFAFVANLNPNKAADIMLRAFASAFRGQSAVVRIAGEGSERPKLEQLTAELGINDQVEFWGRQPREGVRDLLGRSHALISSSRVETFGITLIEAMACGRPVVATRSGGPDSIVNAENGLLVPPDDIEALAGALSRLRANYSHYNPALIRAQCLARYGEAAGVKQLEAIYQQLIGV